MTDNVTPKPPAIDDAAVARKAEEIAQQKVEDLKNSLVQSISGTKSRYGENGPESWDKLVEDTKTEAKTEAVEEAEKRILAKIEAREKEREEAAKAQETQTQQQKEETQKQEWARVTQEWKEAVEDGLLPDINPAIKTKLQSGTKFDDLTAEEKADEGLRAYNESVAYFTKLKQEGKTSSFYRAVQKRNQQPAGASAPVFGSSPAIVPQSGDEYTYEEVAELRKKRFG